MSCYPERVQIHDDGSVWVHRPSGMGTTWVAQRVRAPRGVVAAHYTDVCGQPHEAVEQAAVNVLCAEIERLRAELAQAHAEVEAWFPSVPE